jgi:diazepam-binding inhibitor (GABA receptor modulating acyl-CoA-binding protein)
MCTIIIKEPIPLLQIGPYQPSNDEKLRFYSLFKQATEGPVSTPRPGFMDFVGKAKWDAWKALGDMSKEEAMEKYIEAYKEMEAKMDELGHKQ